MKILIAKSILLIGMAFAVSSNAVAQAKCSGTAPIRPGQSFTKTDTGYEAYGRLFCNVRCAGGEQPTADGNNTFTCPV